MLKSQNLSILIFFISFISCIAQNSVEDLKYHNDFDSTLYPFFHGVASGDASQSSVVIWTRVTPKIKMRSIDVSWEISEDSTFTTNYKSGKYRTLPENDYTVKIKVENLKPHTVYYYRFYAFNKYSEIGITKTLPANNENVNNYSAIFFTGSNFNAGFFNAYKVVYKYENVDAIFHLGDYLYEYANNRYGHNPNRQIRPENECITLQDYLTRYSHYRLDKWLRKIHEKYCWYVEWDDHEFANNSYINGAENNQPEVNNWQQRKDNALKAYYEWMPVEPNKENSVYRTIEVGKLAKFIMLDSRLNRTFQYVNANDTTKTLLGKEQLQWMFKEILKAQKDSVKWIFLMSQVMFAPLQILGSPVNNDQWDGYHYERKKILEFIDKHNVKNIIIISGDIHSSWANVIKTPQGIIIPEFITPSITSPSVKKFFGAFGNLILKNFWSDVKYVDLAHKGYMKLDIKPEQIIVSWHFLKTIKVESDKISRTKVIIYKIGHKFIKKKN